MNISLGKFLLGFALIVLTSIQSNAVRHVGNGGGLNEMKIQFIHQNFAQIISPCLNIHNFCKISKNEAAVINILTESHQLETAKSKISIIPNLKFDFITKKELGSDVQISSSLIYDSNGVPLSYTSLLKIILRIRLYHLNKESYFDNLSSIVHLLSEETTTTNFPEFKIHNIFLNQHDSNISKNYLAGLFIEDTANTYDLTKDLLIHTGHQNHFTFSILNSYSRSDEQQNTYYSIWGPLSSSDSNSGLTNSTLIISFKIDSQKRIDQKTIQLQIK